MIILKNNLWRVFLDSLAGLGSSSVIPGNLGAYGYCILFVLRTCLYLMMSFLGKGTLSCHFLYPWLLAECLEGVNFQRKQIRPEQSGNGMKMLLAGLNQH